MIPAFLIQIVVLLVLVGAALAILQLLPINATIKQIIYILIVVVVCLWILSFFAGGFGFPTTMRQH